jgi:hypothetical protein
MLLRLAGPKGVSEMANETTRAKTVSIACFKCGATISNSFPVEWDEPNAQHFCFSCCKKMAAFAKRRPEGNW